MHATVATEPGKPDRPNEDAAAVTPELLVIVDGASSPTPTGCIHGIAWYAQHLTDAITRQTTTPQTALTAAITEVAAEHADTCDLKHPGTPSAAVGIVRRVGASVDYLALADVTILIETDQGIQVITDRRLDQAAADERRAALLHDAGSSEKLAALVHMREAELRVRNQPGGFWVAAADPTASEYAITGRLPRANVRRIGLLTDGAARGVEMFDIHTWADVLDILRDHGPAELIRQIRCVEVDDLECRRWPRGKTSDDATAIYWEIPAHP